MANYFTIRKFLENQYNKRLELSIPFLPLIPRGNEFIGYHLDMARNFRINFLVEEDGQIMGLVVLNEDGPIEALKLK
jgi:hypothetical protein